LFFPFSLSLPTTPVIHFVAWFNAYSLPPIFPLPVFSLAINFASYLLVSLAFLPFPTSYGHFRYFPLVLSNWFFSPSFLSVIVQMGWFSFCFAFFLALRFF